MLTEKATEPLDGRSQLESSRGKPLSLSVDQEAVGGSAVVCLE